MACETGINMDRWLFHQPPLGISGTPNSCPFNRVTWRSSLIYLIWIAIMSLVVVFLVLVAQRFALASYDSENGTISVDWKVRSRVCCLGAHEIFLYVQCNVY